MLIRVSQTHIDHARTLTYNYNDCPIALALYEQMPEWKNKFICVDYDQIYIHNEDNSILTILKPFPEEADKMETFVSRFDTHQEVLPIVLAVSA